MSDIDLKALRERANRAREQRYNDLAVNVSRVIDLLDRLESAERRAEEAEKERDALREAMTVPSVEKGSQEWAGICGAVAHHLIDRHAENWAEVDQMMREWAMAQDAGAEAATRAADNGVDAGVNGGVEKPAPMSVYGWAVTGLAEPFFGEFAEHDARAEAKRVGGTAVAFPLFWGVAQEGGK